MSRAARLNEVVVFAFANSPAFKKRMDEAGLTPADLQSEADLLKLPIFPKDQVVQLQQENPPFGGMLAVPMSEVRHIFFSPGPIYEPDVGEGAEVLSATTTALELGGFGRGDIVLNALSYHLVPAGLLLDRALVQAGCTVIPGGTGSAELQIKMAADFKATGYVGTASYLMSLIKKIEATGGSFKEDFHITKALVSAEPLPVELRDTLVNDYGLTILNAYATAELGLLAYNIDGGFPMKLLGEPIIQIADPDTGALVGAGAVGEVVVTLLEKEYPLIRYGTGDMAINMDPNPASSAQTDRSIILVGRSGDAVKVRGMFVHPNQIRVALGQVAPGATFQGIISRPETRDHFLLRVGLTTGAGDDGLAGSILGAVQAVCRVKVDEVKFVSPADIDGDERQMLDIRQWD